MAGKFGSSAGEVIAEALAGLGIDLDEVVARVEARLGQVNWDCAR